MQPLDLIVLLTIVAAFTILWLGLVRKIVNFCLGRPGIPAFGKGYWPIFGWRLVLV